MLFRKNITLIKKKTPKKTNKLVLDDLECVSH